MAFWNKKKKDKESAEGEEKEEAAEGGEKEAKEAKEEKEEKAGDEKAEGEEGEAKEGEESEEDAAARKKKKKKMIIIGGACAVMLCVVAGAGAYFTGLIGHGKKEEAKTESKAAENGAPVFYDLPQLLVNLNTGSKTPSFIKVTVTLELGSQEDVKNTQANMPRLLDSYNTFLREMKASDLYGSAGMYRLREEMLMRANTSLAPVKVRDVLFKEILVQ